MERGGREEGVEGGIEGGESEEKLCALGGGEVKQERKVKGWEQGSE